MIDTFVLTINSKENTLIVSKETLEALGHPEYVQLHIDEDKKSLLLAACTTEDKQALVVNTEHYMMYEITARNLIRRIRRLTGWEDEGPRVAFGVHLPEHNAVAFSLDTILPAVLTHEEQSP